MSQENLKKQQKKLKHSMKKTDKRLGKLKTAVKSFSQKLDIGQKKIIDRLIELKAKK